MSKEIEKLLREIKIRLRGIKGNDVIVNTIMTVINNFESGKELKDNIFRE